MYPLHCWTTLSTVWFYKYITAIIIQWFSPPSSPLLSSLVILWWDVSRRSRYCCAVLVVSRPGYWILSHQALPAWCAMLWLVLSRGHLPYFTLFHVLMKFHLHFWNFPQRVLSVHSEPVAPLICLFNRELLAHGWRQAGGNWSTRSLLMAHNLAVVKDGLIAVKASYAIEPSQCGPAVAGSHRASELIITRN